MFNPAAVFREQAGWIVMLRQDRCFYQECGIHHTNTSVRACADPALLIRSDEIQKLAPGGL